MNFTDELAKALDDCEDVMREHVPDGVVAVLLLVRGDSLAHFTTGGDAVNALSACLHAAMLFQKIIDELTGLEKTPDLDRFFMEMAMVAAAVDAACEDFVADAH